jgi:hypothetical protein
MDPRRLEAVPSLFPLSCWDRLDDVEADAAIVACGLAGGL